jgi:3-oxoacyl-[acyl-carrier protein] reductase
MKRKTVIITGSTRGIGRGIALRLARDQHNVVLNYARDEQQAHATLDLCQQVNPNMLLVKADVSQKTEVASLMQQCVERFGSIDVLINNAARVADKPLYELTEQDWELVVDTNMKGTFLCSQTAVKYMLQQEEGGLILNIGASTGIRARKNGMNTCASKAAVMIMTQSITLELGPKIRANTIIPGLTRTEETEQRFHLDNPDVLHSRVENIPLQRIGTPEDVANTVAALLSDDMAFVNGQKIVVDGGQYMW